MIIEKVPKIQNRSLDRFLKSRTVIRFIQSQVVQVVKKQKHG